MLAVYVHNSKCAKMLTKDYLTVPGKAVADEAFVEGRRGVGKDQDGLPELLVGGDVVEDCVVGRCAPGRLHLPVLQMGVTLVSGVDL